MGKYRPEDTVSYKVNWPDGQVSTFSHVKTPGSTFGEKGVKDILRLKRKDGTDMEPVRVKRTR